MPPVPQHVLNWLYSVLTSVRTLLSLHFQHSLTHIFQEYRDVNRAYGDVAQALAQYPSLAPRTDVHSMPCPQVSPQETIANRKLPLQPLRMERPPSSST
jgi:hypothetical protein